MEPRLARAHLTPSLPRTLALAGRAPPAAPGPGDPASRLHIRSLPPPAHTLRSWAEGWGPSGHHLQFIWSPSRLRSPLPILDAVRLLNPSDQMFAADVLPVSAALVYPRSRSRKTPHSPALALPGRRPPARPTRRAFSPQHLRRRVPARCPPGHASVSPLPTMPSHGSQGSGDLTDLPVMGPATVRGLLAVSQACGLRAPGSRATRLSSTDSIRVPALRALGRGLSCSPGLWTRHWPEPCPAALPRE